MTGTFSNNQPDYSLILPHLTKDAKNYWYPLRDIEVVKNSTIDASVNLEMKKTKIIFYGFNTTRVFKEAKYLLKDGNKVLVKGVITIEPGKPFTSTYKSKDAIDEFKFYIELNDNEGNKLVSYSPYIPKKPKLSEVQEKVKIPDEIESVEDLYLAGRFVDQFNRPGFNPEGYYLEALRKSQNDYRVNLAMGMFDLIYYQGKSHEKLGDTKKANELFISLIVKGELLRENGIDHTLVAVEEALKSEKN